VPLIGRIQLSVRCHNTTLILADWAEFDRLVHPEERAAYIIDGLNDRRVEDRDQKPGDKGDHYLRGISGPTLFSRWRFSAYEIGR
jgi:hypothetical protein